MGDARARSGQGLGLPQHGFAAGAAYLLSADATVCELSQKIGYPELRAASAVGAGACRSAAMRWATCCSTACSG